MPAGGVSILTVTWTQKTLHDTKGCDIISLKIFKFPFIVPFQNKL